MMRPRLKRQTWTAGDIFTVRQRDGVCSIGQVLVARSLSSFVSCAFYDIRVPRHDAEGPYALTAERLIATLCVTRELLERGMWRVVWHQPIALPTDLWPNEEFRAAGWVGARMYGAGIAATLLDAYNGLVPWDDWHEPGYLDKLLADPETKPKHLIYTREDRG
ncbi:MAG: hypothetical protein NVS4B3_21660 [Gemmatimonadaceae bacterium]